MPRLIHLNGPPGIGKSTLARRYVAEHRGVLNCDVDVLRTLIGGWEDDFVGAGALIRPAALAMIEAYLSSGHDVVLPQMLADPAELTRFEQSAERAGAQFVEVFLTDDRDSAVQRFSRRGAGQPDDPWHNQVRQIISAQGGESALREWYDAVAKAMDNRADALNVRSVEDDIDGTYERLIEALA